METLQIIKYNKMKGELQEANVNSEERRADGGIKRKILGKKVLC